MRSPSAFEGRRRPRAIAGVLGLTVVLVAPASARADAKQECSAAYDRVQSLRADGKLVAARREAVTCARTACAEFIKTDCGKWLAEVDASTPTVVFEVRDAAGRETSLVRVELDGKPWLDALDGKAKPVDPGSHTLRYSLAAGGALEDTVQVREGEKNRKLTATFQQAPPPPPAVIAPAEVPASGEGAAPPSVAPWIIGGIGVAGLAVGGILAGIVVHDKSITTNDHCNDQAHTCQSNAGLSAASQGRALGPASTVAMVVGGVGVGVGAAWLLARGSAKKSAPHGSVSTGLVLTPGNAAWQLRGSW